MNMQKLAHRHGLKDSQENLFDGEGSAGGN